MGIPEFQRQHADPRGIAIARLISSEFGTAEEIVRRELNRAGTEIEIDGELWTGNRQFIPRARLRGRTLAVVGPERHWKMKYPKDD